MRVDAEKKSRTDFEIDARAASDKDPWTLTACEHKHMPRFRFIDEHGRRYDFSDPMLGAAWERDLRSRICSSGHHLGLRGGI